MHSLEEECSNDDPVSSVSISAKAKSIVERRRTKYFNNAQAALEADDRQIAAEFMLVVKQFDSALEAIEAGVELTEDDITEIPPSPTPYKKESREAITLIEEMEVRENAYNELVKKFNSEGQGSRARMNERMANQYRDALKLLKKQQPVDVASLPVPPGFEPLSTDLISQHPAVIQPSQQRTKPAATVVQSAELSNTQKVLPTQNNGTEQLTNTQDGISTYNPQLKLVQMRQLALKKAALVAKNNNYLKLAMDLLAKAKSLDQMMEASECGLPIKIKEIPFPPFPTIEKVKNPTGAFTTLYNELHKQLKFADSCRRQFQSLGDVSSTFFYEALFEKGIDDLQTLTKCNDGELPRVKVLEKHCPIVEENLDVPENVFELCIERIENLKLPDPSWKASDCSIYVTYNFPFPHDSHQTGRTGTVKGTTNPEFSDTVNLNINRQLQQKLLRIMKRIPLKLEIYQKGGFLRSDKLWGHADIPLAELEGSSIIDKPYEILEGRRRTGGVIHVKIRISKPIAGGNKNSVKTAQRWIELF